MSFSALRRYSARCRRSSPAMLFISRRGARFRSAKRESPHQRTESSPLQGSDGGYEPGSTFFSEAGAEADPADLVLETKAVPFARLASATKSQIIYITSGQASNQNAVVGVLS